MYDHKVPGMGARVRALSPQSRNWSLKSLQTQEDVRVQCHLATGLREALRDIGVHKAFAPHVVLASAQIADRNAFKQPIDLGEGRHLYRNQDVPADGVFIGKGHAFVMSSGGCPIIISTAGEQMIVAHAGRDSLVDRGAVTGNPTRPHVSVVNAIVEAFLERGATLRDISMCMMFSISASLFTHSLIDLNHGTYNYALWEFIKGRWPSGVVRHKNNMLLSLEMLFEEQAREAGVRNVWYTNSLEEFPRLAHTRDGLGSDRRNLFIVKREQAA